MRSWLTGIPSLHWYRCNDPTQPWSERLGVFAGPSSRLGPLGDLGPLEVALASMGQCFAADTLVLASHGAVQIEGVCVGHRVITQPAGMEEPPDMPVDQANYRVIFLEYTEPKSGSVLELTLLRPAGQCARFGVGDVVSLKVLGDLRAAVMHKYFQLGNVVLMHIPNLEIENLVFPFSTIYRLDLYISSPGAKSLANA